MKKLTNSLHVTSNKFKSLYLLSLLRVPFENKGLRNIFLIFCFSAFLLSTAFAQTEKKPELLTKETFIKKVWDYKSSPNTFKYLGDKPCLIDFYADWCAPCRRIAPFMEEFAKTYDGKIYVYKINTDQQKELAALFKANSIPMVIFFPLNGKPSATKGALPKEQYEQLIKEVLLNNK